MKGKKKPKPKQPINVNVNLPKQFTQSAVQSAGKKAGAVAAGIIVSNPIVSLIVIIIAFALLIIIGGFTVAAIVSNITNPWMWILAFIISMGLRPKGTMGILGGAIGIGLVFWIYDLYMWYQATQAICNIPIMGWIICGAMDIALFIPRIFGLATLILTAFIMLTGLSMLRYAIMKR